MRLSKLLWRKYSLGISPHHKGHFKEAWDQEEEEEESFCKALR